MLLSWFLTVYISDCVLSIIIRSRLSDNRSSWLKLRYPKLSNHEHKWLLETQVLIVRLDGICRTAAIAIMRVIVQKWSNKGNTKHISALNKQWIIGLFLEKLKFHMLGVPEDRNFYIIFWHSARMWHCLDNWENDHTLFSRRRKWE